MTPQQAHQLALINAAIKTAERLQFLVTDLENLTPSIKAILQSPPGSAGRDTVLAEGNNLCHVLAGMFAAMRGQRHG